MTFYPGLPETSGSLDSLPIRGNFNFLKTSLDVHASSSANPHTTTLDQVCDIGATTDQAITVTSSGSVITSLLVPTDLQVGDNLFSKKIEYIRYADQYGSIQDAIDDLPEGGGTVYIPSGSYNISSTITIPSNVSLIGAGIGQTILFLTSGSAGPVIVNQYNWSSGSLNENIYLANFTIDGNRDNQDETIYDPFGIHMGLNTIKGLIIENVEVKDCAEQGITIFGENICLRNCFVDRIKHDNVQIGGKNIVIEGLVSTKSGDCGLEISVGSENVTVTNSVFERNVHGIFARGNTRVSILGCIAKNGIKGIWVGPYNTGEVSEDVVVDGCVVINNVDGIRIADDNNNVGTLRNIIVSNNICKGNSNGGIVVRGLNPININVIGNTCLNNGYGIYFRNVTYSLVSGNKCFDDGDPKVQAYGFYEVGTSDYNKVIGNDFRGNLTGEILLSGANSVYSNYENSRFEFNDDVYTTGTITVLTSGSVLKSLQVQNNLLVGGEISQHGSNIYLNKNGPDEDQYIYFYENNNIAGAYIEWQDSTGRFKMSHSNSIIGSCFVQNDVLLNYNAYDTQCYFGIRTPAGVLKTLLWNKTNNRWELNDHLYIDGTITASTSGSILKSLRVQNNEQIGGNLEVEGNTKTDGTIQALTSGSVLKSLRVQNNVQSGGDFYAESANGKGVIVKDKSTGTAYRIIVNNGTVTCEVV